MPESFLFFGGRVFLWQGGCCGRGWVVPQARDSLRPRSPELKAALHRRAFLE